MRRAIAAHNGGPGLTLAELTEETGEARAIVRLALHRLVFDERVVTCDEAGRYRFGDPTAQVINMGH